MDAFSGFFLRLFFPLVRVASIVFLRKILMSRVKSRGFIRRRIEMRQNRVVSFTGIVLLTVGLLLVCVYGLRIYSMVYDCEHGTGAVPVQGCTYFLQLPVYLWSGASVLLSGISLAVVGLGFLILRWFLNSKSQSTFR